MTPQQKLLWEKITKEVRDLGEGNLRARELYDELCKIINMDNEKVILSLIENEEGIEVQINEKAYGNFAVIGLLERIKLTLLNEQEPTVQEIKAVKANPNANKYDA